MMSVTTATDRATFLVEGRWCVEALIDNHEITIDRIVRSMGRHEDIDEIAEKRGAAIEIVSRESMAEQVGYPFHRGIYAVAMRPGPRSAPLSPAGGIWVALPELADESNLGSIIRTAAALGAAGILLSLNRGADPYSRKSIRHSSGAVFRLPVYQSLNLEHDLERFSEASFAILGLALTPESLPLHRLGPGDRAKSVVLFGPEKGGLPQNWLDLCDRKLIIPMADGVDSLNVAACAAITLHELLRRD